MLQNIVSLTKKFVAIKSTAGNPEAQEEILKLALENVKEYKTERFKHNGVKSALIFNTNKRPKKFKVIVNGHLDVVPGKENRYKPKIKSGRLYGVGALDMKASAASLIMAFKGIARKVNYPLGLQLVTDEEVGGFNGTKHQIVKGVRTEFVIAGEPTNFDIVNEAKGILTGKIYATGKTAHGAYPWRGENAIWKMNVFLNLLKKKYPTPEKETWATVLNLAEIRTSNTALNKIPDDCSVLFDIRFLHENKDKISKEIKMILPKKFGFEILELEPPLRTDKNNKYLKVLQTAGRKIIAKNIILRGAHGTSDARHFAKAGGVGVEFGPIGDGIGSDEEWVDIRSLEKYYQILKKFLLLLN